MIELKPDFKLSLFVQGRPRTKGSLKCLGARTKGGKHVLVESHELSKPWRMRMTNEIVREVKHAGLAPGWKPYAGALSVEATFYFEQIGVTSKCSRFPTVNSGENANGDVDKLERNLLDSLQGSGLIADDCNVVELRSSKRWAAKGMPAGVQILVRGLGPLEVGEQG